MMRNGPWIIKTIFTSLKEKCSRKYPIYSVYDPATGGALPSISNMRLKTMTNVFPYRFVSLVSRAAQYYRPCTLFMKNLL